VAGFDPPAAGETAAWLELVGAEVTTPSTLLGSSDPALHSRVAIALETPPKHDFVEELLALFPRSIEATALRHRLEDVSDLVSYFLTRLARSEPLTCSPTTLAMLQRCAWPGNVAQLRRVLTKIARRRRSGVIQVEHLPAECRATSRRVLTQLEALERDAVVQSLLNNSLNVTNAGRGLGMSRATMYRKIRNYGIQPAALR